MGGTRGPYDRESERAHVVTELLSARLRRRVRTAGAEPLLTTYDTDAGARVELSAVTLLNWVDKTSHLLDELGVDPGDRVALELAESAPGHWVTAVWELACWQVGALVVVGEPAAARLLVTGPDWSRSAGAGADVVACSLHPLGLPLAEPPPPAVLDYALEVRGQPDRYPAVGQPPGAPAWQDPGRRLSQADLVAGSPAPGRRLVRPGTPWATAEAAVVAPLLSGGSAVVVTGTVSEHELDRIRRDERVNSG